MKLGIVELKIQVIGLQQTIEELTRKVTWKKFNLFWRKI